MFATRNDQENLSYNQQTAAAAKPLNQAIRGLAPKTPGNKPPKTPFRVPLNDENVALGGGKSMSKAGANGDKTGLFGGKEGKLEKNAFVTPAGPRTRAPLGAKTTNAKAAAFKTPAPLAEDKHLAKPSSPRLRRARIKIHDAESAKAEDGDEEREIEYMAPREIPLPDHPDDWPNDRQYPMFEGQNLTRGWWSHFARSGKTDEEELAESEKLRDDMIRKAIDQDPILGQGVQESPMQSKTKPLASRDGPKHVNKTPLTSKPPSTFKAKSAAAALSAPLQVAAGPSFAAATAAAKARLPTAPTSKKTGTAQLTSSRARHTTAKVVSRTTLGYSKGRAASATARRPLSEIHAPPAAAPKHPLAGDAELDKWLFDKSLSFDDDEAKEGADGGLGEVALPKITEDEAFEDFVLGVPEE